MTTSGNREWYVAKSLYVQYVEGADEHPERPPVRGQGLVEERLVLLQAASRSEAQRIADDEVRTYAAKSSYVNSYGETVRSRFLGHTQVNWVIDPIGHLGEIYSMVVTNPLEHVHGAEEALALVHFGPEDEDILETRARFVHRASDADA